MQKPTKSTATQSATSWASEAKASAARDDLALQVRTLSRLHELAMRLAATSEPQPALQAILETLVDAHQADFGLLSLYDPSTERLEPAASIGFDAAALERIDKFALGPMWGACGGAFASKERVVAEDVERDARFAAYIPLARQVGFCAAHSTPLLTRSGALLGVISVQFKSRHLPTAAEIQLADLCARHAADSIEAGRSRRALRDSEERLRLATQTGKLGIWDWDIISNKISWSDSLYSIHGIEPPEFEATVESFAALIHPQDRELVSQAIRRALEEDAAYELEFRAVRRDGRVVCLFTNATVIREGGRPMRMLGATMDITAKKQAEESLRESEQRFRMVASHVPVGIFQSGPRGECVFVNECWCRMTGLGAEQALDQGWKRALHPEDRQRIADGWHEAVRRGAASETEFRFLRPDGVTTWLQGSAVPMRNSDGELVGYIGTCADITERKTAEIALRESEARFRRMADHAPVMVWVTEADGRCSFLGKTWYAFTGRSPEASLGFGWIEAMHPDDRDTAREIFVRASERHAEFRHEYRLLSKDGSYRWMIDAAVPRFSDDGTFLGYIGSVIDITNRKRTEEALRNSQAALLEADRRKDEFLALLAHELRNPLAPIRTGLELMRLAGDDRSVIEEVRRTLDRQSQQMVRLIDDLLDVSRITRGTVELRKSRVELAQVMESAAETARPVIEEQGHRLNIRLPKRPVILEADPTRLAQVISNLLNNAAKYMARGGTIDVRAERHGSSAVVSVKDCGIGIPADMLDRIFDMFIQVDGSLERSHGGLGIGLTLVKRLVEMHGGTVEARSAGPQKGSEFIVRLPIVLGLLKETDESNGQGVAATGKRRILVVDDNENAAQMLGMLLKALGSDVRIAFDGLSAIEIAAEFRPDVVLLDIGMPKLDGYETARRMRAEPWGKSVTLAALTGWGQEEDKRRTRDAGFDHHFVKPLEPNVLQRFLAECEPNG